MHGSDSRLLLLLCVAGCRREAQTRKPAGQGHLQLDQAVGMAAQLAATPVLIDQVRLVDLLQISPRWPGRPDRGVSVTSLTKCGSSTSSAGAR
jgi:hypothetical protein